MSEDKKDKEFEAPKNLSNLLGNASAEVTFNNMQKLINQNEYEIAGVKYKRKILKPKELVKLYKLQTELDKLNDPEKRMNNIKDQAQLSLMNEDGKPLTDDQWDNTDAVMMEIVVGACLLISKGFRQV